MTEELMSIGTYSLITRLSLKALRFYEERELLVPAKREITGYRYYSYTQIRRGLMLRKLSNLGFGVQEMRLVLDAADGRGDRKEVERLIAARVDEVKAQVQALQQVMGELENQRFEDVIDMNQEISIKELPPMRVVARRELGTYQETISRLISQICDMLYKQQARMTGPPMVIYYDQEYKETNADIEVAQPIAGRVTVPEGFEVKTLPGGRFVSVIHRGPFQQVGEAWGAAFRYIGENHLQPIGPGRELYLSDPSTTAQEDLLTEVQLPIK